MLELERPELGTPWSLMKVRPIVPAISFLASCAEATMADVIARTSSKQRFRKYFSQREADARWSVARKTIKGGWRGAECTRGNELWLARCDRSYFG